MIDDNILIALGANLPSQAGVPQETIGAALRELATCGIGTIRCSRLYRTPAWPDPHDPPFVNAVARVRTALGPWELMQRLHETETAFGRTRSVRNAPRPLDLDLLDYAGRVESGPPTLPHPRLERRAFVLVPLGDVMPDWRHPISGRSLGELLAAISEGERSAVVPLTAHS